ncbi:MAG: zinc ribbon domain-containing protein [Candidatus Omnitrophota bacterium]
MPTYEYECRSCGHHFEKSQSITAEPLKTCPKCGKEKVARLISLGSGFIFKGSLSKPAACPSAGMKPDCSHCPKS